ncbi:hypothetical protein EYZ11_001282 [Aspergillus tanneri]|uniref:Uncharacterized protein n=1 Tax=Aspergillus tanneri TaxID=1220188 RepID=A0A4S3JUV7_9EURO|nr:hypothetical protein EYZ11_001282 [Aspergillus tanneri]
MQFPQNEAGEDLVSINKYFVPPWWALSTLPGPILNP